MKRLLLVAALSLGLTACGSAHPIFRGFGLPPVGPQVGRPVGPPKPPAPASLRFSAASNREFARHDVQRLLRIVVVPRSARQVAEVPKSAPSWFREELSHGLPGAAVAHRNWIVDEPLKRVVRFIQAHARSRPRPEVPFREPSNRIGSRPHRDYLFHPIPGRSWSRWLNLSMLALPNGATVVSAQAGDEWIHTPPRSAELPATVRRIDITSRYGQERPSVRLHVRDRFDVGSIVSWVNGLGLAPSDVVCLDVFYGGPVVTLTFRAADGAVLARARVSDPGGGGRSGPCNPLSLTVNGKKAPPLISGDLLLRIQQHLNADLAPPTPSDVSVCLRQRGWKVQTADRNELVAKVQHFPQELTARKNGARRTITFHATGKVTTSGPRLPAITRCLRHRPGFVIYG